MLINIFDIYYENKKPFFPKYIFGLFSVNNFILFCLVFILIYIFQNEKNEKMKKFFNKYKKYDKWVMFIGDC